MVFTLVTGINLWGGMGMIFTLWIKIIWKINEVSGVYITFLTKYKILYTQNLKILCFPIRPIILNIKINKEIPHQRKNHLGWQSLTNICIPIWLFIMMKSTTIQTCNMMDTLVVRYTLLGISILVQKLVFLWVNHSGPPCDSPLYL